MIRLGLSLIALILVLFFALRLTAPYLISSSVVRSAIAASIAEWTGHDVSIDDVPEVRFWPEPEVTLTGVTVSRTIGGERQILGEIDRLSARFGLLSSLRGKPDFSAFRFERPRIRIWRGADGRLDWTNQGRLSEAVRAALARTQNTLPAPEATDAEIGSVDVVDGEIIVVDRGSGHHVALNAVSARIEWPELSAPLSGKASFQLNDRPVTLSLQTPTPLLLIGGEDSQINLSTSVSGINGAIDGLVNTRHSSIVAADIDIQVADVPQTSASLGVRLAGTERWRSASLKASVTDAGQEWQFEGLRVEINDSRGDGILTLKKRPDGKPLLSGTLALDHLEIGDLLQALSIDVGDRANVRLPSLTGWVDVDMRLSASTAAFQAFRLTDLGASLVGRGDALTLVIGDTRFLGGMFSARLSGSGEGFDRGAQLSVMMEKVDLASLMSGFAIEGPSLKGTGTLTLDAKLVGTGWRQNVEAMSGKLEIAADNGEILGFDTEGLRRLSADRAYFQLSAAGSGGFDYRSFDMSLRFSDGSAEVEKARIVGDSETLLLSGIVPYSRKALALTGELSDTAAEPGTTIPLRFFIGGGWSDPVISPIPPVPVAGQ
ncbi:AsmA protein [Peteryoungia aggregata LMG 23059]|uniref:AsmA protein n=1 Tax=Peteryoungia aggregata LMG 23059 TaxID=1368425 RepID=A0ABU0G332_9HYPH|nr:AsmA-like C-terminal region-containing protein [Peteryoungia aggregata]MDQ0419745.1 AsmA protein [Peteryoungia aggregata LMG 23059]